MNTTVQEEVVEEKKAEESERGGISLHCGRQSK